MQTRWIVLLLSLTLAVSASTTPALAASPAVTAQAQAADAGFLAYAPPPPHGAGALCLVDTGVNSNPDTQPGLVSAIALDGGSGADADPNGHGTTMAMIAGAAGSGMIGAWPQLKIMSVRATNTPSPGQDPTYQFKDYFYGIQACLTQAGTQHIDAIDLALSSTIPPSPDQAQEFAEAVQQANQQNVAIVAAAGDQPGAIQEPAVEPGVLAVGASTAQSDQLSPTSAGAPCNFSASQGLTFFAPGCGVNEASPSTDAPLCCGNGTSQASAFAAAVLVALMSYDPSLSYSKAEQLLLSTTNDGNLDVAAAFNADGLSSIVNQGNANIPQPPSPSTASTPAPQTTPTPSSSTPSTPTPTPPATPAASTPATTPKRGLTVSEARWRHGVLTLVVDNLGAGRLHVHLEYQHHAPRDLWTGHESSRIRTARPARVLLTVFAAKSNTEWGGPITVHVT